MKRRIHDLMFKTGMEDELIAQSKTQPVGNIFGSMNRLENDGSMDLRQQILRDMHDISEFDKTASFTKEHDRSMESPEQ